MSARRGAPPFVALALLLAGCGGAPHGGTALRELAPAGAADSARLERLPIAEIERATGLHGLVLVGHDAAHGAGAELNVATSEGDVVLGVSWGTARDFEQMKAQTNYVNGPVPGIGDEALDAPKATPGYEPYAIYVRKGERMVSLGTLLRPDGRGRLTRAQLRTLAAAAAARL